MQSHFFESQRQRYNSSLQLSYSDNDSQSIYRNYDKSLALLNEICELSQTQQGRTIIRKIYHDILGYKLMKALKTYWHYHLAPNYRRVDNAILRIIVNLVIDLRFYQSFSYIKKELYPIRGTCNPTWNKLTSTILASISEAEQRKKEQASVRKFKASFSTKEQAAAEIHNYEDFLNFSERAIHFGKEYESYIDMLRGALRVGAHNQVMYIFPKSCFGCVIFSMVNSGQRVHQQRVALTFLKELTGGWFTQQLFDYILYHMKNLYRKIWSNTKFEDRHQYTCLKFHQYDRSIYQYFNKLGDKFRKGTLAQSKKIRKMGDLEKELNRFRQKQKLSQQSFKLRDQFTRRCYNSTSFLEMSTIAFADKANHIKQFLISKTKSLGFDFFKIAQKYDHQEQYQKFKLRSFVDCSENHSMFLARCEDGKILGGYFTYPHPYDAEDLIGTAELFTFDPTLHFDFGEVASSYQIVEQRLKKCEPEIDNNVNTKALVQDYERYKRYNNSKRYEDRQYEERRRQYFGSDKEFNEEKNLQKDESSEEEQQTIYNLDDVSYRVDFMIDNRIFKMALFIKKESIEQSNITWKRLASQLPCRMNGETQMLVQIDRFEFYLIEAKKPKNQ